MIGKDEDENKRMAEIADLIFKLNATLIIHGEGQGVRSRRG